MSSYAFTLILFSALMHALWNLLVKRSRDKTVFIWWMFATSCSLMTLALPLVGPFPALSGRVIGLAAVGVYGVIAYAVSQRTREIGIRMAVGARPRDILRQFLVESVLLSCIGGVIGFGLGVGLEFEVMSLAVRGEIEKFDVLDDTLMYSVGVTLTF